MPQGRGHDAWASELCERGQHLSGDDRLSRYARQVSLPVLGRTGQERLSSARVGLVGCGGLGAMVANHLVRAGVGCLRVVDSDLVELNNLHRQILYTEDDVRRRVPKAEAATAHLRAINSHVSVEPWVTRLDESSLPGFADGLDLLIDGSDNFPTRFFINDYSVCKRVPWIYGGVLGASGMSMTIVPGEGPCLACLLREMPPLEGAPTAETAGVLNTVVAVIASVEATEAIKLIVAPQSRNRGLLLVDLWDLSFDVVSLERDLACRCCGTATALPTKGDV